MAGRHNARRCFSWNGLFVPAQLSSRPWRTLAALALCLMALLAWRPLALPDEGRYAEIGRWMLMSGDWLAPRLDGMPFFHKPPLLHWLQALSFALFGVHPWAARLVPAAHAVLMMVTLYLGVRQVGSPTLAWRSSVILGTSLACLVGGQYVNHDMMVATWISLCIGCFALAMAQPRQPHAWLARAGFVASALGVLSKGLMGLALPGLVLLLWMAWTRRWRALLGLPWLTGVALFAAVAVPWFWLAQNTYPQLLSYLFGEQQFHRYTAAGGFNNVHPWWFYGVALALLLMPWSGMALGSALASLGARLARKAGRRGDRPTAQATDTATVPTPELPADWVALCWIWLVAIVVFFSIPTSKIVGYMLPVMPPCAVLIALHGRRWWALWQGRLFNLVAVVGLALGVAGTWAAGHYSQRQSTQAMARTLACLAHPSDTLYVTEQYPYDLPFYLQSRQALRVAEADWPHVQRTAGDNWQRELLDSADFAPEAERNLVGFDTLAAAAQPGTWLLTPLNPETLAPPALGWHHVATRGSWMLWSGQAPTSPPAAPCP